jgi:MFS family permease
VGLFGWLLWGDFAWQMKERATQPVVQVMLRQFKASDFLTGFLVVSLPSAIGIFLTPIISYRSDRHRGRWGRRIPFLLATAPLTTLSMCGMAFSPWIGTWLHGQMGWGPESLNLTVILVLGSFWTLLDFATVVANAVFGALVNDVVPRELIGRFYGLFRVVSLLAGILFNNFVIGHAKEAFVPILAGVGLLFGVGITLMCLRVKEGDYPPPPQPVPGGKRGFIVAVKAYVRDCFSKPYYLWVYAAMGLAPLSFLPVNLFSVYAAQSFGLTLAAYGKYIVVTYCCSLVLAYPLGWLADRFHPLRMALGSIAVYAVVMVVGYFGILGPKSFGWVFLAHGVLGGCYFTGAAALGPMLLPKLKFAEFASAGALLVAGASIILGPAMGGLLDVLGHDYRYTFAVGGVIAVLACGANLAVYRRFMALGGPARYTAPE